MQRVVDDLNGQIKDIKRQLEEATRIKPAENFKAKSEFSRIATDPEKSQEFFRKGMRYYSLRQLKRAVDAFRKSLEYDPANEWAKKSLERTLYELEQEKNQRKPAVKYEEIRYTARKGDTLRSLAGTFYGDAGKWPLIRDVNPDVGEQQEIAEGTVIVIPQIPEISVPAPEAAK
jgi:nucleoid-associated protein YgaU